MRAYQTTAGGTAVNGPGYGNFTQAGLLVRPLVDSPAMTSLCGSNTRRISLGVWAVVTAMAGLAGVLLAPVVGLSSDNYQILGPFKLLARSLHNVSSSSTIF